MYLQEKVPPNCKYSSNKRIGRKRHSTVVKMLPYPFIHAYPVYYRLKSIHNTCFAIIFKTIKLLNLFLNLSKSLGRYANKWILLPLQYKSYLEKNKDNKIITTFSCIRNEINNSTSAVGPHKYDKHFCDNNHVFLETFKHC